MNRRDVLKYAAGNAAALAAMSPLMSAAAFAAETKSAGRRVAGVARKPNVILILADDLGFGQLGCQGGDEIPTPNIDSIAADGVRFTDGYVSCPVCSPTRAGLLTGRYQQRFGHEFNPGDGGNQTSNFGLSLNEKTIANHMKDAGYATGIVGKWHLGAAPEYMPTRRGFDEFFGFTGGAHPYFAVGAKQAPIIRGTETVKEKEYLTDAFAREAVSFIDRHRDEPFFLYLAFNAVHMPIQAQEERINKFKHIKDEKRRNFAAMLCAMDDGVGSALQKLRDLNLEENTLVMFLSDNGGPTLQTTSLNTPLSGYKGQVYEGGIRVPFMMKWKSRLPGGYVYRKPVISLDLLPTALDAAGAYSRPPKNLDGASLLPYIQTKNTPGSPHERLFWRYGAQHAVRSGDWKLARVPTGDVRLYNLAEDISEQRDQAMLQTDIVRRLKEEYEEWNAYNVAPLWTPKKLKKKGRKKKKK